MTSPFVYVGGYVTIPAGKRIIRDGIPSTQQRTSTVTVRKTAADRRGKTRVFWKSMGYLNSALV